METPLFSQLYTEYKMDWSELDWIGIVDTQDSVNTHLSTKSTIAKRKQYLPLMKLYVV